MTPSGFGASVDAFQDRLHSGPSIGPLNLLHACYGLGAALGPAVMTALLAAGLVWRLAYAGMVGAELALLVAVATTWRSWSGTRNTSKRNAEPRPPVPLALVGASLAMFFVYRGVEVGAGQWSYTFLTAARALPATAARLAVSGYWAGLTLGRLAAYATGARLGPLRLLHVSVVATVAASRSTGGDALRPPGWLRWLPSASAWGRSSHPSSL